MRRMHRFMTIVILAGTSMAFAQATQPAAPAGGAATRPAEAVDKDAILTKGRIDAVTVYRGQAMVTRAVEIGGPAGLREIVVTDLPDAVVPGSIFAESANGVEVRSVRYRIRPVSEDVREEVRQLDEQIRATNDRIEAIQRRLAVLNEHKQYLAKLEGFVAPTADRRKFRNRAGARAPARAPAHGQGERGAGRTGFDRRA